MKKKHALITLGVIIILVILLKVIQFFALGSFGLRPASHGCIGFKLNPQTVVRRFPHGEFHIPFVNVVYRVDPEDKNRGAFCLGQDVWYGE